MKVITEERRIVIRNGASQVYIEPWGENSVRVRMTAEAQMDDHDWALCEKVKEITPVITQTTVDMTDPWYRVEVPLYRNRIYHGDWQAYRKGQCRRLDQLL